LQSAPPEHRPVELAPALSSHLASPAQERLLPSPPAPLQSVFSAHVTLTAPPPDTLHFTDPEHWRLQVEHVTLQSAPEAQVHVLLDVEQAQAVPVQLGGDPESPPHPIASTSIGTIIRPMSFLPLRGRRCPGHCGTSARLVVFFHSGHPRRGVWGSSAALVGLISFALGAREPRVLLFVSSSTATAHDALVDEIRIQLANVAEVEPRPALGEPTFSGRIARATHEVIDRNAALGVWTELRTTASGKDVLLCAVSKHRERSVIEIGLSPGASDRDAERALALKLGALLDTMPAWSSEQRIEAPERPARAADLSAWLEAGTFIAKGAGSSGVSGGAAAAAGARISLADFALEPYAFLRLPRDTEVSDARGRVTTAEIALGGGARALYRTAHALDLGGGVEAGIRRLDAVGTAPSGETGAARRDVPAVAMTVDVGARLFSWLAIRVAAGVEVALRRQVFSVGGETLEDFGRVRPTLRISGVLSPP
jgi:hypothetical protein